MKCILIACRWEFDTVNPKVGAGVIAWPIDKEIPKGYERVEISAREIFSTMEERSDK